MNGLMPVSPVRLSDEASLYQVGRSELGGDEAWLGKVRLFSSAAREQAAPLSLQSNHRSNAWPRHECFAAARDFARRAHANAASEQATTSAIATAMDPGTESEPPIQRTSPTPATYSTSRWLT